MFELISLIFLLFVLLVAIVVDPAQIQQLDGFLSVDQSLWAAAILVLTLATLAIVAHLGLPHFAPTIAEQAAVGHESLAWPGHVLLPLALLGASGYLIATDQPVPAALSAALLTAGIATLANWVRQQWALRQPPEPAGQVEATPRAHAIRLNWRLPDDPRLAGVRVLRTDGSEGIPEHAWLRIPVYAGLLESFEDRSVEPGRPYYYTVFTVSGRGRAGVPSGFRNGRPVATTPRPSPVQGLEVDDRLGDALILRWYPLDFTIKKIIVERRGLTPGATDLRRETDVEKPEFVDRPIAPGLGFEYRVVVINEENQASDPALVQAATRAPAPELTAEAVRRNHVDLRWSLPTLPVEPQKVLITRRREDELEAAAELIYDDIGTEFIDEGPQREGLEYETKYLYTIQASYVDPVKGWPASRTCVTGGRVQGLRSEDILVDVGRRMITLRWRVVNREQLAGLHFTRTWEDLVTGRESVREWDAELDESFVDTNVDPAVEYRYTIQLRSRDGHLSERAEVTAELLPPPRPVEQAVAMQIPDTGAVILTWRVSADPSVRGIRVVRRFGKPPLKPADGDLIFDFSGQPTTCSDLPTAGEPIYAVFTYDDEQVHSEPVVVRIPQPFKVMLMLEHLPDSAREVSNQKVLVRAAVAKMIKSAGVPLDTVTDWTARVAESGQELSGDTPLGESGVRAGQTVVISYTLGSPGAPNPESAAPDPGPMVPDPEPKAHEPTALWPPPVGSGPGPAAPEPEPAPPGPAHSWPPPLDSGP